MIAWTGRKRGVDKPDDERLPETSIRCKTSQSAFVTGILRGLCTGDWPAIRAERTREIRYDGEITS